MGSSARRPRHGGTNHGRKRRKKLKRRTRLIRLQAKRARRAVRARGSRRAWKERYWWEQAPVELGALMKGMDQAYPSFALSRIGRALICRGDVNLDTLHKTRRLVVIFPGRPSRVRPIVMADGPTRSRHRFSWARPSSLCLYYGPDDERLRWTLKDGLITLIDLSRVHLIKEAWWRITGEWEGWEVHRRSPAGTEQKPRRPKQEGGRLSTEKIRLARVRCWCGTRRYVNCHRAIALAEELQILGLERVCAARLGTGTCPGMSDAG